MRKSLNEVFVQLVNQNLGIAHKICRVYFTDPDDRDDVLQEMMYQLYKSYGGFNGRAKFSTWMYSVCLNTALTYRRKDQKQKHELLTSAHEQIPDPQVGRKAETIDTLYSLIATLPPLNKAIVLLFLEDLTYEEIAEITGLSKANVSVKLVRIKRSLEQEMKKRIEDDNH
ncbi:MAG TPA: sigma-70 family RNA polymerase sigma factor [Chryseolinea sp.]